MTQSGEQIRILVVDDEPLVLNMAVYILNQLGYENIETADDGSTGLKTLKACDNDCDLVICDLNMPGIDGIEFMRRANESGFTGALVLLSGEERRMLDSARDLAQAHKINVLGAIQKPLKPEMLKRILDDFDPALKKHGNNPQQAISVEELESGIAEMEVAELALYYQPKVAMATGEIVSVEALARWQHHERGLLAPEAFIPVAEKEGLINPLTLSIYRKAVQQLAQWAKDGIDLNVSVNFSINTFILDGIADFLTRTLREHNVSPKKVTLEVTETQIMENAMSVMEILMRLRLKKFGLSIDDFGTGTSSMIQLKNIPFSELKIDKAFVTGATNNSAAAAILETSVDLAKRLGMSIVAEGVESKEDWDYCARLGIDYVQGYFCAGAMPEDELLLFLQTWDGPQV